MSNKIIHLMISEKFTEPFIGFMKTNFDESMHKFIILSENSKFVVKPNKNVINISTLHKNKLIKLFMQFSYLKKELEKGDKIIIHGMWSFPLNIFFYLIPHLLKKSIWIIWGGDLYFYRDRTKNIKDNIKEFFRKNVIKNLGGIIAYNKEEFDLASNWYENKTAKYYESFFYLSNLYEELKIEHIASNEYNIQVGNSADKSNNHIEILKKLSIHKNKNIKIYVPLSYGDLNYAKEVIIIGKEIFGDKFIPTTDYMGFSEYISLLGTIDIAIFNHNRQQAMGNITTLLGLGKKVYMRTDITSYSYLNDLGINIYDTNNFELTKLSETNKEENIKIVKEYFSKETLIKQWEHIINDSW